MNAETPAWIADQTRSLLAQRGHAWLLSGPAGLGQYALALGLVKAWLCEHGIGCAIKQLVIEEYYPESVACQASL